MNKIKKSILCIEDDEDTCELLTFVFEQLGYEITTFNQIDCLSHIGKGKFSAIILDNHFDGMKGTDICQDIRSFDRVTPIIFFSGEVRQAEIEKALANGATAYLIKPNDFERLTETVINLIDEAEQQSNTLAMIS